jgi:hypothetical protein
MRAMLGRFGLSGSHHLTPIVKLSGGQKARVVFASIALSQPHILLLDEVSRSSLVFVFAAAAASTPGGKKNSPPLSPPNQNAPTTTP